MMQKHQTKRLLFELLVILWYLSSTSGNKKMQADLVQTMDTKAHALNTPNRFFTPYQDFFSLILVI